MSDLNIGQIGQQDCAYSCNCKRHESQYTESYDLNSTRETCFNDKNEVLLSRYNAIDNYTGELVYSSTIDNRNLFEQATDAFKTLCDIFDYSKKYEEKI